MQKEERKPKDAKILKHLDFDERIRFDSLYLSRYCKCKYIHICTKVIKLAYKLKVIGPEQFELLLLSIQVISKIQGIQKLNVNNKPQNRDQNK